MTIVFGDDDPEDGYDAGDPFPRRALVAHRTASSIARARFLEDPARTLVRIAGLRRMVAGFGDDIDLHALAAVILLGIIEGTP